MASDRWAWDPTTRRYKDLRSGRFVQASTVLRLRDDVVAAQARWAQGLAAQLADGRMTVAAFEREFRTRITKTFTAQYLLGRGGRQAMVAADYGRIGAMVKTQYRFARGFAEEIATGTMTETAIAERADLYAMSSRQAFERARGVAWDVDLPQTPADGSQDCRANCRCHWRIEDKGDRVEATWELSAGADHCATCTANASSWSPLVFPKE